MNAVRVAPLSSRFASLTSFTGSSSAFTYSLIKFRALQHYTASTSRWRVAAVLFTTPLYGLVAALLPSLIPQQDPLDPRGVRGNPGFLVSIFLLYVPIYFGAFLHWRAGSGLPSSVYSNRDLLVVTMTAVLVQYAFVLLCAFAWRFPIPMGWILGSSIAGVGISSGFLVAFGSRLRDDAQLREGLLRYMPAMVLQTTQLVLYPAFSVLFDHVSAVYQVLLTLVFPVVKYFMKKLLKKYTHPLEDFGTEVAVSGVEICASLYQSMILQNAPSRVAVAVLMAVDVAQGLVTVKFFLDRKHHTVPRHLIMKEAWKQLESPSKGLTTTQEAVSTDLKEHTLSTASTSKPSESAVVRQALELVNAAESILLVEYLEVAIPLVNAVFVAVSCQFGGAQYNTRLRYLYLHPEALGHALGSIVLYAVLQGLSFAAMHLVMKHRYGLSALYHLAFLLERHQASIVGKTLAWLPILLHFTGVHYGIDFSFRFDYAALLTQAGNK